MGRRQARASALQALFQMDVGAVEMETALRHTRDHSQLAEQDMLFTRYLVEGVTDRCGELDEEIVKRSKEWQLQRLAAVDRNILRLALFEILYDRQIPAHVSINEAVELAKIYGGDKSSKFVNGLLAVVVRQKQPDGDQG